MSKKLKAFTLVELIVAMALSGMVIAIAGVSYIIVGKQLGVFNERASKEYSLHRAASLLSKDFQENGLVFTGIGGIRFEKDDGIEITYQFEKAKITRLQGATHEDLGVGADDYDVFFSKEKGGYNGFIDELNITLRHDGQSYDIKIGKHYSAAEMLQIENP